MADYITSAALKATLELGGTTFADADITTAITSASRAVEKFCDRRTFTLDGADSTRYYTAIRPLYVSIDDLVTLTSFKTDHDADGVFERTWTLNSEFKLEPLNADTDGRPWEGIRLTQRAASWLPLGLVGGVQVVGRFGWPATPTEVVQATTILAGRLLKRARETPNGIMAVVGMDGLGALRIARTDPDVPGLLEDLSRRPILAG